MWEYIAPSLALLWTLITESGAANCGGTYCIGSCCGSYPKYCCSSNSYGYDSYYSYYSNYSYSVSKRARIVGAVIGVFTPVGIIIGIIVCVCVRRNRNPRHIVKTTPTNNTTVVPTRAGPAQKYPGGIQPYAVPPQYQYNQAGYQPNQAPGIMPSGGQFPYGEQPAYDGQFPNDGEQSPNDGQFPSDGEQPPSAPPPYTEFWTQPEPPAYEIS